ncbi:MAG: DUF2069 domain-containing protein [Gammaproteobacteria bacterium]|jgi:uncharacterized membrane protein
MNASPGRRFLYALTLVGYFGVLGLLIGWYGWLSPPEFLPVALALLLLVTPLLFPLRGILHGRPYTFAWSCFLALLYFTHGVMEAYSSEADRYLGLLEVVFASLWFLAATGYIRAAKN